MKNMGMGNFGSMALHVVAVLGLLALLGDQGVFVSGDMRLEHNSFNHEITNVELPLARQKPTRIHKMMRFRNRGVTQENDGGEESKGAEGKPSQFEENSGQDPHKPMPMSKRVVSEFNHAFLGQKLLDLSAWRLPPGTPPSLNESTGAPILGSTNKGSLRYGIVNGTLVFNGDSTDAMPLRALQSFSAGVTVGVDLIKSDRCSSHYIVFSTNPNYVFPGWGKQKKQGEDISLLFGFNCNAKYAYGMEQTVGDSCMRRKNASNATAMFGDETEANAVGNTSDTNTTDLMDNNLGENSLELIINGNNIEFKDSRCGEALVLNESIPYGRRFYMFIGADQDSGKKLSAFTKVSVTRSNGCDEYNRERHPPLPRKEYTFWDDFETGKCGTKWAQQGPQSVFNLTAEYTFGFDGAGTAEVGCQKNNLWFAGSSEGHTSLRIRRPFLGPNTAVTEISRTERCNNHWFAVARSKRYQYGRSIMVVKDSFNKKNSKIWWYPPLPKNTNGTGETKWYYDDKSNEDGGKLWFQGPTANTFPMRLKNPLTGPFVVKAGLQKTHMCSSQYIVLTTNPFGFLWSWENTESAVKFVWNCNEKYIYGAEKKETSKTKCSKKGHYDVEIHATDGKLRFRDNNCKDLMVNNPFTNTSKVYLLIGADSDTAGVPSSFSYLRVLKPEGASSVGQVVALLGWQCNTKVAMVSGMKGKPLRSSSYCPYRGNIRTEIEVANGQVVFRSVHPTDRYRKVCPDVSVPADFSDRGIYYFYAGANPGSSKRRAEFRYFSTQSPPFDLSQHATHTELYFADQFASSSLFEKEWTHPEYDGPRRYGLGVEPTTKEKFLWVQDTINIPIRTKRPFIAPFTVVSDVVREERCSNHFITLTSRKSYNNYGAAPPTKDVIRFQYDCDTKSAFYRTVDQDLPGSRKVKCDRMGRFHVTISVQEERLVFSDGRCDSIAVSNPFPSGTPLYLYIGANHNEPNIQSKFYSFQVMGRMTFKMPKGAVMKDDFTQYDDWFVRMWTPDASVGAEVDQGCGTAKEGIDAPQTSFHFGAGIYDKSDRILTTARMPFRRGGEVEFWLRYGLDKGHDALCQYMDNDDGVVLEFSTENAYDGFEPIVRLPAHHFGRKLRNKFMKVRTTVDALHHAKAMTGNTFLRWSQESSRERPQRGDWAIDRVIVFAKPAAPTKLVWNDRFVSIDLNKWWVPKKALQPGNSFRLQFNDALSNTPGLSVWGPASGNPMMRTKRMFTSVPGVRIDFNLVKDHRCSSHFVAIAKNKNFQWSWGSEKEVVKFAWNCERKYIYAPDSTRSTVCQGLLPYEGSIDIGDGKAIFADSECTELTTPLGLSQDDVFYIFIGADQDTAGERSRFTNFTIYEKEEDDDKRLKHSLMQDSLKAPNQRLWTPPKIHKFVYGYRPHPDTAINGSLYFRGDAQEQQLLRTSKSFQLPFIVSVDTDRDSECAGHFIVVSTNKRYRFRKGPSRRGDAIVFGYDKEYKYIYGKNSEDTVKVRCPGLGLNSIKVTVRGSMVVFEDLQCPPLMAAYPVKNRRLPLYVMLGANREDVPLKCSANGDSLFQQFEILGRKPVAGLIGSDEGVLLSDDFNFRMKADPSMWQMENTTFTGRVDKDCGSVSGGSLHFRNPGERVATTAEVDVQRGAEIDFFIRYGGGNQNTGVIHTSCTGLNPGQMPADGVEVQYMDETGSWHSIVRYDAPEFAVKFVNFTKITIRIDSDGPEALASRGAREAGRKGIRFRWIQLGDNKKCCGHWALDNVQVRELPPLPESIEDDDFSGPNPTLWHYPLLGGSSKYKYGYSDTLWFSGDASGMPTVRTLKRYPMGLLLRGTIDKSDKCSSHFIALSPDRSFSWRWGGMEKTIVFAWNCNDKYIYSPYRQVSRPCSAIKKYNFEIEVQDGWVRFSDENCGDMTLNDIPGSTIGPYYIHIGADQDSMGKKSKFYGFEILNVEERIRSSILMDDKFERMNTKNWVYPQLSSKSGGGIFGYDSNAKVEDGRLWFSGNFNDEMSVRSISKYSEPLIIKAGLQKTAKCSSHYIALTTNPSYKWNWGPSDDAIKFVWNCDDKYIYTSVKTGSKSTKCSEIGSYNVDIRINEGNLVFTDGRCNTLETRNPFPPETPFYVLIGADNDFPKEKSVFKYIRILKPEGRPAKDRQIVMWDDFNFKDDLYRTEWDMEATTGRVDNQCISVDRPAMHFRTNGTRVATTKTLDILHGADIHFVLMFGSPTNLDCYGIFEKDDGVELQYSVDEGKNWERVADYPYTLYGDLFATGGNTTVTIDYDHTPGAMSTATQFRWIQHKTNSNACCNHWALGSVTIDSYMYPVRANTTKLHPNNDSFSYQDNERKDRWGMDEYQWNIFNTTGRPARKFATEVEHERINIEFDRHTNNKSKLDATIDKERAAWMNASKVYQQAVENVRICEANIKAAEEQIAMVDPEDTRNQQKIMKNIIAQSSVNETDNEVNESVEENITVVKSRNVTQRNATAIQVKNISMEPQPVSLIEVRGYFQSLTAESINTVKTLPGNPTCNEPYCKQPVEETNMSDILAVRCCSETGEKVPMIKYGCHRKNYSEAKQICEDHDLRLCTVGEIKQCLTCYMGCGFDMARVWTSTGDERLELSNLKTSCAKKRDLLPLLKERENATALVYNHYHNQSGMFDDALEKAGKHLALIKQLYRENAILFKNDGERFMTTEAMDLCNYGATVSTKLWGNKTTLDALVSQDEGVTWIKFDSYQSTFVHRWERVLFQLSPSTLDMPSCKKAIIRIVENREKTDNVESTMEVLGVIGLNKSTGNETLATINRTNATSGNDTIDVSHSYTSAQKDNYTDLWAIKDFSVYVGDERVGLEADILDNSHSQQFCYPFNNMTKPYGHHFMDSTMWFWGDNIGKSTVRSRKTFTTDSTVVSAEITHTGKCDNQFIALSKDPYYKFDVDNDPQAIKFLFNCGKKVLIAGSDVTSSEVACFPRSTFVKVQINISKDAVVFTDNAGCKPLVLNMTKEREVDKRAEMDETEADENAVNSTTAGSSPKSAVYDCDSVKSMRTNPQSGMYFITLGGDKPMRVFCDMKQDGGGWTLVAASNGHIPLWSLEDNATLVRSGRIYPGNGVTAVPRKVRFSSHHPQSQLVSFIDESDDAKSWFKIFRATADPASDDGSGDGNAVQTCKSGKSNFYPSESNQCRMKMPDIDDRSTSQIWGGTRYQTQIAILAYCGEFNKGAIIMGKNKEANVICEKTVPVEQYPSQFVRIWMKFEKISAVSLIEKAEDTDFVVTSPGNPKCRRRACKRKPMLVKKTAKLAVRCCVDQNARLPMSRYGCNKRKTYKQAENICRRAGARLCSIEEIQSCKTCGTGCGFDYRRIWTKSRRLPSTPKAKSEDASPVTKVRTMSGRPGRLVEQETLVTDKLAVRCCSDVVPKIPMFKYGCNAEKTFEEAKAICTSRNFRLCTIDEIKGHRTSGTGCGYDNKRIWTSTVVDGGSTRKTLSGNPKYKQMEIENTPEDSVLAIRCCADSGKLPMNKYNRRCKKGTFVQAQALCKASGARLCSVQEIEDCKTCGTGCGFDAQRVWTKDTAITVSLKVSTPASSASKPADKKLKKYKTVAGNPRCNLQICRKPPMDTPASARLAVRCCSKAGGRVSHSQYGCNNKKTFSEAKDICENKGFRLCTVEEIEKCVTCGTGCGYDHQRIWSSTEVKVDDQKRKVIGLAKQVVSKVAGAVYKTVAADGTEESMEEIATTEKAGVICCNLGSNTFKPEGAVPDYGCHKEKTYPQARAICQVNGKRLCSAKELVGHSDWSGCNFNASVRLWSSTGRIPEKSVELPKELRRPPLTIVEVSTRPTAILPGNELKGDSETLEKHEDNINLTNEYDNVKFFSAFNEVVRNFKCSKCSNFYGFYNDESEHPRSCSNSGNWGFEFDVPVKEVAVSTADYEEFRSASVILTDEYSREIKRATIEKDGFLLFSARLPSIKKVELKVNDESGKRFCLDNIWWGGKRQNRTEALDDKPHVIDGDYYIYVGASNASNASGFKSIEVSGRGSVVNDDDGSSPCENMWDCEVSQWGPWSNCSHMCDEGVQTRKRTIIREPKNGGRKCPPLTEHRACLNRPCNCVVSDWSNWTSCISCDNVTGECGAGKCGGGQRYRNRSIIFNRMTKADGAAFDGKECPSLQEAKKCEAVGLPCDMAIDSHKLATVDTNSWCYQSVEEIFPYKYSHIDHSDGGIQFSGNATEQGTLRSRVSYKSLDDLYIETEVSKVHDCANHFVVVSTQEYFAWSEDPEPDTFKFLWNCTSKQLIGPSKANASMKCYSHHDRGLSLKLQTANAMKRASLQGRTWKAGRGYDKGVEVILKSTIFTTLQNITENSPISYYIPGSASAVKYWKESGSSLEDDDDERETPVLLDMQEPIDELQNTANISNITRPSIIVEGAIDVSTGFRNILKIFVGQGSVSFQDEHCEPLSITEGMGNEDFFVYLGATPNEENVTAEFRSIRISGDGSVVHKFNTSKKCPVRKDCVVTPWSEWSNCTELCLGGTQFRTRNITQKSAHGGVSCPVTSQTRQCNVRTCDCILSEWSPWSDCSLECGGGTQYKRRRILFPAVMDGKSCPSNLTVNRTCNKRECARLGVPSLNVTNRTLINSTWETFKSQNDEFCYQDPDDIHPYSYGGFNGSVWFKGFAKGRRTMRSRESFQFPLRIDFIVERTATSNQFVALTSEQAFEWNWDSEPETFKFGWYGPEKRIVTSDDEVRASTKCKRLKNESIRARGLIKVTNNSLVFKDDSGCPPLKISINRLKLGKMTDVFMYMGADQSNEQILSIPPKNETRAEKFKRMRRMLMARRGVLNEDLTSPSIFHAVRVSGEGSLKHTFDKRTPCPKLTDCEVSEWGNWTKCTEECGSGTRTRNRTIITKPKWGGALCPALTQEGVCNTQDCGRDCRVSEWAPWGECSRPCNDLKNGGGHAIRTRKVIVSRRKGSHFGLDDCPVLRESKRCNTQFCGKDCVMSEWTPYTNCSAECGGGAKKRYRTILALPKNGSHFGIKACPAKEEIVPCNTFECTQVPETPRPILKSRCSQYSVEPTSSFPFAAAKSPQCSACVADPECGFCPNSGKCLKGNARGPLPRFEGATHILPQDKVKAFMYAANCSAWQFSQCISEPCREHTDCGSCMTDPVCGWCSSTKTCSEGDLAGSSQEFCPRGWLSSPYHADWLKTTGSDNDDMDDNDFFPETTKQKIAMQSLLNEKCALNDKETEAMIAKKVSDEVKRVLLLKQRSQRCYPCNGTWPDCTCFEPSKKPLLLRASHVARRFDEASSVDKQLPRADRVSSKFNYGQEKVRVGGECTVDDHCASGSCVEGMCCKKTLNKCSGHGTCVRGIECKCEIGFLGKKCEKVPVGANCIADRDCISGSCARGVCCSASLNKCNNKGRCVSQGKRCQCDPKHAGEKCETLALFKKFGKLLSEV